MTATRDRRSDLDHADEDVAWDERALLNSARGWPWWGAVLFAFGLSIVGAIVDYQLSDELGTIFHAAYFIGCVGGICVVRRNGLFGPMVQPPLILGITVPATVLSTSSSSAGGLRNQLLTIGTPLINGFPTMALTTGVTVGIGLLRVFLLQKSPHATARRERAKPRTTGRGSSRGSTAKDERRGQRTQTTTATPRSGTGRTERPGSSRTTRGGSAGTAAREQRGEPRGRATDRGGDQDGGTGRTGRGSGSSGRDSTGRGGTGGGVNPARERGRQPRPGQGSERRRPSSGEQRRPRDDR
ncbi:MAG: DUF6542 domain-containing protein [Sciscionella sp.]